MDALRAEEIRSDEAYPGGRIPALAGPVAAVRLGKVDRSVRMTSVEVIVMSPAKQGGGACEATALRAVEAMQRMGGTCVKNVCRFDEMADVFYIEIQVQFFGTALENGWSPGPGYAVKIGSQPLNHVVSFGARRETDKEVTAIANAKWRFTLEELLPPGAGEPPDPSEPFTVTITRTTGDETFTGCRWISVKREETIRGVTQIREGNAENRSVVGIL